MGHLSDTSATDREVMRELGRRLAALLTIVRLLRVYGRLAALESFIPEPEISPMAVLEERRAR